MSSAHFQDFAPEPVEAEDVPVAELSTPDAAVAGMTPEDTPTGS